MSHPVGLPDLFLDRSLGRNAVAQILRSHGLRLTTLSEHYGMPQDQMVADETWLAEAGQRGWVVLMKDKSIRRNAPELTAVKTYEVRCFCLARQDLLSQKMAERFLRNLDAMIKACRAPGPFIYAVHEDHLTMLRLEKKANPTGGVDWGDAPGR